MVLVVLVVMAAMPGWVVMVGGVVVRVCCRRWRRVVRVARVVWVARPVVRVGWVVRLVW